VKIMASVTITEFQRRVYAAVKRIPRGRVSTYGEVATFIGCRSSRAVGQALRRNPFAPRVPCHRVVAADGSLGGFAGTRSGTELTRKRCLLAQEGVGFDAAGRLADPQRRWDFGRRG
jgi:methylated-DNA-[protein]-cysteine S-methyltransferase